MTCAIKSPRKISYCKPRDKITAVAIERILCKHVLVDHDILSELATDGSFTILRCICNKGKTIKFLCRTNLVTASNNGGSLCNNIIL